MTVKLVVLYTRPEDPEAFDRHYLGTHAPLAQAMPGLQRFETGLFAGADQPYYRGAELTFADRAALGTATSSPAGKAATEDFARIAAPGSIMLVQDLDT